MNNDSPFCKCEQCVPPTNKREYKPENKETIYEQSLRCSMKKFDQRIVIIKSVLTLGWVIFGAYSVIQHAWLFLFVALAMIAFNAYTVIPSLQALVNGEDE